MPEETTTLKVGIDSTQAVSGARAVSRSLNEITSSAARFGVAAKGMGGSITAVANQFLTLRYLVASLGIGYLAQHIVRSAAGFETLRNVLITTTGSAVLASLAFDKLTGFAAKTPFQLEDVASAFNRLAAFGFQPTIEVMGRLGNMAAAFGTNFSDLTDAVLSAVVGRTESIRRFGITAKVDGEQVKLTFGGISKIVQRSAKEVAEALAELTATRFGGAMERLLGTVSQSFSNLGDAVGIFIDKIGRGGLNQAIAGVTQQLTHMIEKNSGLAASLGKDLGAGVRLLGDGMAILGKNLKTVVSVVEAFVALKFGQALLGIAASLRTFLATPQGLAFVGIMTALYLVFKHITDIKMNPGQITWVDRLTEAFKKNYPEATRLLEKLQELSGVDLSNLSRIDWEHPLGGLGIKGAPGTLKGSIFGEMTIDEAKKKARSDFAKIEEEMRQQRDRLDKLVEQQQGGAATIKPGELAGSAIGKLVEQAANDRKKLDAEIDLTMQTLTKLEKQKQELWAALHGGIEAQADRPVGWETARQRRWAGPSPAGGRNRPVDIANLRETIAAAGGAKDADAAAESIQEKLTEALKGLQQQGDAARATLMGLTPETAKLAASTGLLSAEMASSAGKAGQWSKTLLDIDTKVKEVVANEERVAVQAALKKHFEDAGVAALAATLRVQGWSEAVIEAAEKSGALARGVKDGATKALTFSEAMAELQKQIGALDIEVPDTFSQQVTDATTKVEKLGQLQVEVPVTTVVRGFEKVEKLEKLGQPPVVVPVTVTAQGFDKVEAKVKQLHETVPLKVEAHVGGVEPLVKAKKDLSQPISVPVQAEARGFKEAAAEAQSLPKKVDVPVTAKPQGFDLAAAAVEKLPAKIDVPVTAQTRGFEEAEDATRKLDKRIEVPITAKPSGFEAAVAAADKIPTKLDVPVTVRAKGFNEAALVMQRLNKRIEVPITAKPSGFEAAAAAADKIPTKLDVPVTVRTKGFNEAELAARRLDKRIEVPVTAKASGFGEAELATKKIDRKIDVSIAAKTRGFEEAETVTRRIDRSVDVAVTAKARGFEVVESTTQKLDRKIDVPITAKPQGFEGAENAARRLDRRIDVPVTAKAKGFDEIEDASRKLDRKIEVPVTVKTQGFTQATEAARKLDRSIDVPVTVKAKGFDQAAVAAQRLDHPIDVPVTAKAAGFEAADKAARKLDRSIEVPVTARAKGFEQATEAMDELDRKVDVPITARTFGFNGAAEEVRKLDRRIEVPVTVREHGFDQAAASMTRLDRKIEVPVMARPQGFTQAAEAEKKLDRQIDVPVTASAKGFVQVVEAADRIDREIDVDVTVKPQGFAQAAEAAARLDRKIDVPVTAKASGFRQVIETTDLIDREIDVAVLARPSGFERAAEATEKLDRRVEVPVTAKTYGFDQAAVTVKSLDREIEVPVTAQPQGFERVTEMAERLDHKIEVPVTARAHGFEQTAKVVDRLDRKIEVPVTAKPIGFERAADVATKLDQPIDVPVKAEVKGFDSALDSVVKLRRSVDVPVTAKAEGFDDVLDTVQQLDKKVAVPIEARSRGFDEALAQEEKLDRRIEVPVTARASGFDNVLVETRQIDRKIFVPIEARPVGFRDILLVENQIDRRIDVPVTVKPTGLDEVSAATKKLSEKTITVPIKASAEEIKDALAAAHRLTGLPPVMLRVEDTEIQHRLTDALKKANELGTPIGIKVQLDEGLLPKAVDAAKTLKEPITIPITAEAEGLDKALHSAHLLGQPVGIVVRVQGEQLKKGVADVRADAARGVEVPVKYTGTEALKKAKEARLEVVVDTKPFDTLEARVAKWSTPTHIGVTVDTDEVLSLESRLAQLGERDLSVVVKTEGSGQVVELSQGMGMLGKNTAASKLQLDGWTGSVAQGAAASDDLKTPLMDSAFAATDLGKQLLALQKSMPEELGAQVISNLAKQLADTKTQALEASLSLAGFTDATIKQAAAAGLLAAQQSGQIKSLGELIKLMRELRAVGGLGRKQEVAEVLSGLDASAQFQSQMGAIHEARKKLDEQAAALPIGPEGDAARAEVLAKRIQLQNQSIAAAKQYGEAVTLTKGPLSDYDKMVEEIMSNASQAISTHIEEAITQWQGFANFLESIVKDIATILIRLTITKPLEGLISESLGKFTGQANTESSWTSIGRNFLGSFLGGLASAAGGWFGGSATAKGTLPEPVKVQGGWARGTAQGGEFTVPNNGLGKDRYPVWLNPGEKVHVTPFGMQSPGGAVRVNVINPPGQPANVKSYRERMNVQGEREIDVVLEAVAADVRSHGRVGRAVHESTRTPFLGGPR